MKKLIAKTFLLSLAFLATILGLIPFLIFSSFPIFFNFSILSFIGLIFLATGLFFGIWSVINFVLVGEGTPAPIHPPKKFVSTGPYKFTRNPMYFGMTFAIAGEALVFQSLGVLIYSVVFFFITYFIIIPKEESTLIDKFGASYKDYLKKVPRFIPVINNIVE